MLKEGLELSKEFQVTEEMLAQVVGSGDLAVLATPTLIAQAENLAMLTVAPYIDTDKSTVGGAIAFKHLRPTALNQSYTVQVRLHECTGKKLSFTLKAYDKNGLIGEGTHIRFIIDKKHFLAQLD